MNSIWKALVFGFLTWLIPFVVAIPFYGSGGVLLISLTTFKTIMIIVGSLVGVFFLYQYFKHVSAHYIREGFIIGGLWLVINIVFDSIVLIPMAKISFSAYLLSIGLRYLSLFFMSVMVGYLLNHRKSAA